MAMKKINQRESEIAQEKIPEAKNKEITEAIPLIHAMSFVIFFPFTIWGLGGSLSPTSLIILENVVRSSLYFPSLRSERS
jgi:hypothetical protein